MARCPYKVRFGMSEATIVQCAKQAHEGTGHEAVWAGVSKISWLPGDRREFTGNWPGYCTKINKRPFMGGCILPLNHQRGCAT